MTALRQQFLDGMSRAASTVNVVTTDGASGRAGVTVSAMSSVSADTEPPTLLVCVHRKSPAAERIRANGVFCVNLLRAEQAYVSDSFAGRFKDELDDKFDCAGWRAAVTGAPLLDDGLVAFDCRLTEEKQVGEHHVFFGEVAEVALGRAGAPLVYAHRAYGSPARIETAASLGEGREAGARRLSLGCFHSIGASVLPEIVARLHAEGADVRLLEGDQRRLTEALAAGEIEAALLYDLDELSRRFEVRRLASVEPYVLLPAGHRLAGAERIAPVDLAGEPMVLLDAPPSAEYFPQILREADVEPRIAFRSASFETVRGLVAKGLGYTLLATRPVAGRDGLVARPLATAAAASDLVLATRQAAPLSPMAARLVEICGEIYAHRR